MNLSLLFLLLPLCACAALNQASLSAPYTMQSRSVGDDAYELVIDGKRGIEKEQLKGFFQVHGKELCRDRVYLLRGMREESLPDENRYVLRGLVDCVGEDYFSGAK
jgi:hypothetical protein